MPSAGSGLTQALGLRVFCALVPASQPIVLRSTGVSAALASLASAEASQGFVVSSRQLKRRDRKPINWAVEVPAGHWLRLSGSAQPRFCCGKSRFRALAGRRVFEAFPVSGAAALR
nr:putative integron gene cassette protein [uncultured bacterium]